MRLKKEIEALTQQADDVEFPQPAPSSWEQYLTALKTVVDENLGYNAAKALTWDEYQGKFYFDLTESVDLDDFRCHVRCSFDFDPRGKDLGDELQRLQEEIARWKSTISRATGHLWREQVKAAAEAGKDVPDMPKGMGL